jgi:hypothetical protein
MYWIDVALNTGGALLWMQRWTCRFYKMWRISWRCCRERVRAPGEKKNFGSPSKDGPARVKVGKQSRKRRKQDGRWRPVPSSRQLTTSLPRILSRKTKIYATNLGLVPTACLLGPGNLFRLPPPPTPPPPLVGTVFWLAEDLLYSQERLCSTELVS